MSSPFNPSRLTLARRRRGMTQTMLAEAVGVSARTVTAWESGASVPERNLTKLAEILNVLESFFSGPTPDGLSPAGVSFRKLTRLKALQRDQGLAAGELTLIFSDWIESHFDLPVPDVPEHVGVDSETAAMSVRAEWGLGELPIRNMIHLLEAHGVRVFSMAEECRELDAYSFWRSGSPYIFLNTMKSAEHRRQDAAHELGHLVLHRKSGVHSRESEQEANHFGSALLMPKGGVIAEAPWRGTLDQIVKAKRRWNVSAVSLIYRMHRLGLLTEWQYRSLMIEASERGYRTNEPNPAPAETSQVLAKVFAALREDGIMLADVARQLDVHPEEVTSMVFGLALTAMDGSADSQSDVPRPQLRVVDPFST